MKIPGMPRGFRMAGVHCGVKSDPQKPDLMLLATDQDAVAAGVYTRNLVRSAAVEQNQKKTPGDDFRFVVANSGNANTCTGEQGWQDTLEMVRLAAEALGVEPRQGLVMSTGIIGEPLPMDCIANGISQAFDELRPDSDGFRTAAEAICTTDKSIKVASRQCFVGEEKIQISGMAKGAGMIGPNMATMLAVVTTDAALSSQDAHRILSEAVDHSFNCISVEGHMSTSDTVLLFASGAAQPTPLSGAELDRFAELVREICIEMARMIPDDGEGASHLITIDVQGCRDRESARQIARTVADSPLVKTGIMGADPNWGRIVSAAGYAGVPFDPNRLTLSINDVPVFNGAPVPFDERQLSQSIREHRETRLELGFGEGDAEVRFWTSDLTHEYVSFNSEYTT